VILNHWFSKCGLLAHQLHCVTVTGIKILYTNVSHVGISDIRNKKTELSSQLLKSYHAKVISVQVISTKLRETRAGKKLASVNAIQKVLQSSADV
jgi:hypothetical protein